MLISWHQMRNYILLQVSFIHEPLWWVVLPLSTNQGVRVKGLQTIIFLKISSIFEHSFSYKFTWTTDVEELHKWHVAKCTAHPYFERIPDAECLAEDPAVNAMLEKTEEGIKVARLGGNKYFAVFRRREEFELPPPQLSLLWSTEEEVKVIWVAENWPALHCSLYAACSVFLQY